ncbi:MAG TPA: KilA-N domain-containing protein [Cyanophyceae cyanobacterium]
MTDNVGGLSLLVEHFEGHPIYIRPDDDYWNLTAMCKAKNKRINNFLRSDSTWGYLKSLTYRLNRQLVENSASEEKGITLYFPGVVGDALFGVSDSVLSLVDNSATFKPLIEVYKGGIPELQGTWGHQRVALRLAAWLDPDLDVWVYEIIEKLLTQGRVELEDEIDGLRQVLTKMDNAFYELECEHALLEHNHNQALYALDESKVLTAWHRANSWNPEDYE